MSTTDDIRAIFYSSGHAFTAPEDLIREIAFLVDEGYLRLKKVVIASRADYNRLIESVSRTGAYEADGGGNAHIALKKLSADYVARIYGKEVRFEASFCGYYPDVVSHDATLVVECGQTNNPDKILDYFRLGAVAECIQVPYPDLEDTSICGYSFTAAPSLSEFLELLHKDRRSALKDLITKRG